MFLFPAIDLYEGKAVRLLRGDYNQMTVYSNNPAEIAHKFEQAGASHIHLVDLEGAKTGQTPNLETIKDILSKTHLFAEVGGGIRTMEVIDRYLSAGVNRVILGTAAVTEEGFVQQAVAKYGDKIAVGVDIKDGCVAIKGWTESSGIDAFAFCEQMQKIDVSTLICTDISKDGMMQGTNRELYQTLSKTFSMNIIASGGVSSLDDVKALNDLGLYGAIIGKAYYTGAIDLKEAIALL